MVLPPGRARLATNPAPTGSAETAITIGIVRVACLAAWVGGVSTVTMTSTLRRTSSAANSPRRLSCPSPNRYSMLMLFPSTHPRSRRPCRNESRRGEREAAEVRAKKPIRGTLLDCCWASEVSGAAPSASSASTASRLFIQSLNGSSPNSAKTGFGGHSAVATPGQELAYTLNDRLVAGLNRSFARDR